MRSMTSSMSMVNFQKKLLDHEKQINNNSDKVNKRLTSLEDKVIRNSHNIKKIQDTIDQIERKIWLKHREAIDNQNKAMQKINAMLNEFNLTQKPIVPNIEYNQLNNSTNLDHNHEYKMLEKEQFNEVELEISSHENYSIELPRSRDSKINHQNYRAEKPRE